MRIAALVVLPLLAACGGDPVEDAEAPARALVLQPIGYPEIEANDLHGPNCSYASGKSMAPVVMAFGDEAVMKIDGEIHRFPLDPQCKEVRNGTGSRYLADDRVLDLAVEGEGPTFDGSVKLSTGSGKVLYETSGAVQCGD
ncbi:hypothetical protein GRI89_04925 [Altererythrobacter salegens]|uniref:Lipoprotein n=1 Tax=Croceibacterium salegens TaxID=1737568 RepID=A0A6I4SSM3_9SPHN|nr:hypothetical protein [Croceibacterium salegens]MXO58883.1 hypothetical protein [Croceibacterium salegens]